MVSISNTSNPMTVNQTYTAQMTAQKDSTTTGTTASEPTQTDTVTLSEEAISAFSGGDNGDRPKFPSASVASGGDNGDRPKG